MRIAITGATGFTGSHLATRLSSEGHEVVRLARRPRPNEDDILTSSLDDVNELAAAFKGCHAVAHCVGINREIGDQTYERVHVEGIRNVVEAAKNTIWSLLADSPPSKSAMVCHNRGILRWRSALVFVVCAFCGNLFEWFASRLLAVASEG